MREKTVSILDKLSWSIQVPTGLTRGDYYRAEARFNPHPEDGRGKEFLGVLEVVAQNGKLLLVEFDEINSPNYHIRKYQNASKRYSGYAFMQAQKERTGKTHVVLVNGMTHMEGQMLAQNRLTGDFDFLTGASNSIRRGMLPLAEEIAARMEAGTDERFYGLAREVEPGVTARMKVVVRQGVITSMFYDEILADDAARIADEDLKAWYRQSKYHSLDYMSDYPCGFNRLMDAMAKQVVRTQRLADTTGMLFADGPFSKAAWGHYLAIAGELEEALVRDGALAGGKD